MFGPTLTTLVLPHSVVAKSFTKLMHEISGDYIDPIHLEVTTPLPTYLDATTPLPTRPKVMLGTNPPTQTSVNGNSKITKT
jgi:hypothetical protein